MFFVKKNICPFCKVEFEGRVCCLECLKALKILINEKINKTKDCSYITAPFIYKDIVREAILDFKFQKNLKAKKSFCHFMKNCKISFFDVLVCVPTFNNEFNSSLEIAKTLKNKVKIKFYEDAIKKIKKTKHQHNCSFEERLSNLKDAFWADPSQVAGKNVLICDDIITTMSTVQEIAATCKKAGALYVGAISFAISNLSVRRPFDET